MTRSADGGSADPDELGLAEATELYPREAALSFKPNSARPDGTRIGSYALERVIGEGGGGVVFAGKHRLTGDRVAIKVLRPEMVPLPHLVTRFNREVEAINRIRHPNIVRVIECGKTSRQQPYYVMELLEGVTLRRLVQLHGRFSPAEVLELFVPICGAVQAVHDAGFVHRDLKPSNVMVVDRDGHRIVKLLDFGIAKMVHGEAGPGLTEPGATLGSAHTMAPEQVRCEQLDGRADIYALGVVMFQLLTGDYPFQAEDPRQIALMHLQTPPARPSDRAAVSPAVDAVVLRCLEKNAQRRFGSANELLAALRVAVDASAGQTDEHDVRALGIYLELTTLPDAEFDDAMIEDISSVLDIVEHLLTSRQYAFPLRTSNALLAVRMPASEADAEQVRVEVAATISELRTLLAERPEPHPDVQVALSMRANAVRFRTSTAGTEIVGGPLLEVGNWTANRRTPD